MGKNFGTFKYIIKGPITNPVDFFKYGGFFYALLRAVQAGLPVGEFTIESTLPILIAYVTTQYLPPSSIVDVVIPVVLGATIAGVKWRASQTHY